MSIFFQPSDCQFGDLLIDQTKNDFSNLIIISAFAKTSGVLRIKKDLQDFKHRGGTIKAFIGCDADGTSYEALVNLFEVCEELYVIHYENPYITFHPKSYTFFNDKKAWCFIGSNNLTGGGYWINVECGTLSEWDLSINIDKSDFNKIIDFSNEFSDVDNEFSKKINNIKDLDELLENEYIQKEIASKLKLTQERSKRSKSRSNKKKLFGSKKIDIPSIPTELLPKANWKSEPLNDSKTKTLLSITEAPPSFTNEQFWFEMREGTGGSRNILDLSMVGKIIDGAVTGTKYELPSTTEMLGGVSFFDIDPNDHTVVKDMIINYNGLDYFPSTLKFTQNNGSWRLQLKGDSTTNNTTLSEYGVSDFQHNILVFEKIRTDYYVLSVLPDDQLDGLKLKSQVYAYNGKRSSIKSKTFGML